MKLQNLEQITRYGTRIRETRFAVGSNVRREFRYPQFTSTHAAPIWVSNFRRGNRQPRILLFTIVVWSQTTAIQRLAPNLPRSRSSPSPPAKQVAGRGESTRKHPAPLRPFRRRRGSVALDATDEVELRVNLDWSTSYQAGSSGYVHQLCPLLLIVVLNP